MPNLGKALKRLVRRVMRVRRTRRKRKIIPNEIEGLGGCVRLGTDTRIKILNDLIKSHGYERYLEIGTRTGATIAKLDCPVKHGVDPAYECSFQMTSDEFFEQLPADKHYDLVFIDGLHLEEQVDEDFKNALAHLSEGGTIAMHDCNPKSEELQRSYDDISLRKGGPWNGTVWRSFAKLRMTRKDLTTFVLDTDHGLGIIQRGEQNLFNMPPGRQLDYSLLDDYRKDLLNLLYSVRVCTLSEAGEIARNRERFWLSNCECRQVRPRESPLLTGPCLTFGESSPSAGSSVMEVSRSEVEQVLRKAEAKHLVPMVFRDDKDLRQAGGICFCSDDFCRCLLRSDKSKYAKGAFVETTECDSCASCGKCELVCCFSARKVVKGQLIVHPDACYGCGLCADVCPQDCIQMVQRT